jgi:hypothetical protein
MKQFVRNLKIFRTMPGRFVAVAVLAAAAFTFTNRAQADPGRGAVVVHRNREATGGYYAVTPDGQLRLDVATTGQGDFIRHNPDGTWTLQSVEPRATMTLSVPGSDGSWVPMWIGSGSFHIIGLVEPAGDAFDFTDEAVSLHVEGKFTNVPDGSKWSFLVVAVEVNYEFKELKIDLQPR